MSAGASNAVQVDVDDMRLLKQRQSEHAAGRAHKLKERVIAQKEAAADKKEAEKIGGPVPYDGPIPSSCSEYSGSRAIGCTLTLAAGFEIDQFPCLDRLWKKESGWNYRATNHGSGAYGIPQALPGKKMASAGADWKTNPATQIKWGLGYVRGRYDTPCGAWSHFQNAGSY